jgi:chromosome segregation protein
MRLKKIEVLGFKSFADRQVVLVDDHVTVVVGPNGCGKSNIVDAIRWCMGEQSAKHLRGAGMADVIFAGCSSRGPAGMAEVTLTFAAEGTAPPPYSEMTDVAITRRLFADGTSEYVINKVPARLRDITELLAGTGVGTKGYSIIEQGQVGKIVGSKPEERRSIIDEAAGITRFKAQKVAASRKIDATRQNLLRVRDVIAELDDRLGTLRRQAQKAERYKKYRADLRDLELWQAAQRLLELHATRGVLEHRRGDLGQHIDDTKASLSARDAQIGTLRISIGEVEQELVALQQRVYDVDNRIRLREAEDDYRRRERESQLAAAAAARAEAEGAERAMAQYTAELGELEAERTALGDGDNGGAASAVERLQATASRVEAELWTETSRKDAAQRELGERQRGLSAAQARSAGLAEALASAQARLGACTERCETVAADRARAEARRDELDAAVEQGAAQLASLRGDRAAIEVARANAREALAGAEVELDTSRAELHRARSRLQSLEEIQARYRGCASGVQVVMEHADVLRGASASMSADAGVSAASDGAAGASPRPVGIVADHLEVPQHLEIAMSAVLGDRLEGIVVDDPGAAVRGVDLLKHAQEGRLAFVPRTAASRTIATEGALLGWSDPTRVSTSGGSIAWVDASRDDATVDAARGDAATGDAATGDAATGDAATGDAPTGDAATGDAAIGDAATDDAAIGDAATEDRAFEGEIADAEASREPSSAAFGVEGIDDGPFSASPADVASPVDVTSRVEVASPAAAPRVEGVLGRLGELVGVDATLAGLRDVLFGDTVVVEGLPRALELWSSGVVAAPMVTLDGDRIDPSGVVTGGSPTALNSALLQQKREIRELHEIVASLQEAFEQTRARHLAHAGALAQLEAAREQSEADLLAAQTRVAADEALRAAAVAEIGRLVEAGDAAARERQAIVDDESTQARELATTEERIVALRARIGELEGDLSGVDDRIAMLTKERDALAQELTDARVELARWQQRSDALGHAVERLVRQEQAERARLERLQLAVSGSMARASELETALAESTAAAALLIEESREATAAVHGTRERHDALRLELDELEASVKTLRTDLDDQRERLQEVELGVRENAMERSHLDQDVRDRLDVELSEILVDFHDRALFGAVERERAAELKRVISRMGEVNLTAIDEFQEVSVRFEYLTRQRDDLEHSVTQLQEAIDRIDKTTRQMFRDTFNAVNEKFQQIFPRLFAGGRAELKLTQPDDLLETGVEIVAQPPGKQLRSLDLLSGGEKALTATSLIFAIFLIKPSPFCLLDEVDAPLDEVNVGRFCNLVRELAATTQFVIITHNKVTMETGDRLYGVTMEQRGVSKLVSVNVRRAVELAYN